LEIECLDFGQCAYRRRCRLQWNVFRLLCVAARPTDGLYIALSSRFVPISACALFDFEDVRAAHRSQRIDEALDVSICQQWRRPHPNGG